MDPELEGQAGAQTLPHDTGSGPRVVTVAPSLLPGLAEEDNNHAAQVDSILAELQAEGAPVAPSGDDAPPGTWTWANIKKNLKEVPGQVVRGAAEGVNATVSGTEKMASWLNENVVDLGTIEFGGENGLVSWRSGMPTATGKPVIPDSVLPAKPETGLGQITNDAAQLVVGLVGASKVFKVAEGASLAAGIAGRVAQGAIADFSVFDGNDENISNFIQSHPRYANAVTEFLATKPGDNEAVNRLKRAVEGGIIGAGLEGLIASAKVARAWSKGDKKAAREALDEIDAAADAQAAAEKAAKEAPATPVAPKEGEQLDMFGQPAKAAEEAPVAAPAPVPKEGEQLALSLGDEPMAAAPGAKVEPIPGNGTKGAEKPVGTPEVKKIVTVDDENFKAFVADRDWNKGLFKGEGQAVTTLNTQLIDNVDEVGPTINAIASAYEKEIKLARGGGEDGVVTWSEVQSAAKQIGDLTGGKPQMILNQLAQVHKNSESMAAQMKAFADFHASVAKKVDDLATYVADEFGPIPPGYSSVNEVMADFAKHTELLANVQAMYGGAKTNLARTFNAFKLGGQARDKMLAGMDPDQLFAGGPAAMRAYASRIKGAGGSPKAIGKVVERGFLNNVMKFGQQIWINGILSNPITHAANVMGSAMHMAYLPAEKMLAGALTVGSKEGRAQFVEGALQYRNIVADFQDALKLSVNAFKREGAILDPGVAGLGSEHGSMRLTDFMRRPNGTAEWVFNTFSQATNLSSRLMIAEDELVKQMAYRSRVRARAGREWHMADAAGRQGMSLEEYTTRALDSSVDPRTGQGLDKIALEDANRVTFSNNLKTETYWGSKSLGQIAQSAVNDHPFLRFVMPFVRTPTNIGRFVWSRTPGLNLLRKEELMNATGRNGSQAQAEWAARSASGALLWGTAGSLALDGTITGAGPSDPEQRKLLQGTGWMPYSIRVNQPDGSVKYISYAKMDPFGLILGMAADLAEASGHLGDEDLETIASHMGVALAQNLKNKSYFAGLANLLNAFGDPDRNMAKFMRGQVGSWVPSSLKAFNSDPYMREARTVVEELRRRVPGLSQDVDPVRNVFGEKVLTPPGWGPDSISPFLTGVQSHNIGDQPVTKDWQKNVQFDVADELARQAYIHGAKLYSPPKDLDGVDLTEFKGTTHSALDRYRELIAQPKAGMPSLKQALQKLVVSPQYQTKMTDGEPGEDGVSGTRQMMIQRVIGQYRQAAKVALFRENPAILEAVKKAKMQELLARRAAPPKQPSPVSMAPAN